MQEHIEMYIMDYDKHAVLCEIHYSGVTLVQGGGNNGLGAPRQLDVFSRFR